MYDELVTILENKKINSVYYNLFISSPCLSKNVRPGQFLNIQIEYFQSLFLRRPFSYYRVVGNRIEILYAILGRGSALLAEKRKGDRLKMLGPLGRPFSEKISRRKRVLVGGGVGVPPLVYLAETVSKIKRSTTPLLSSPRRSGERSKVGGDCVFLIGCKTKKEVLPKQELSKVQCPIQYATDDGSYGEKGFVTVLLHDLLKKEDPKSLFIQTCGPNIMMSAVRNMAKEFGVEGEASVEERMACGVGACLGCVVETHEGFKTSCVEGPVFSFSELM